MKKPKVYSSKGYRYLLSGGRRILLDEDSFQAGLESAPIVVYLDLDPEGLALSHDGCPLSFIAGFCEGVDKIIPDVPPSGLTKCPNS